MTRPVKTLGIIGGGQLGRMSALAAAKLGIKTYILTPETNSPASHVAARSFVGNYEDPELLKAFAESVDVIGFEFENIPIEIIDILQEITPVYPGRDLLAVSQHRPSEKTFLNDHGIATCRWAQINSPQQLDAKLEEMGLSHCIIKTSRFGYDGKGQIRYHIGDPLQKLWSDLMSDDNIIEEVIDFTGEISVIVLGNGVDVYRAYPPSLNQHRSHILNRSIVPAGISQNLLDKSVSCSKMLASKIKLRGILAIEFFVTRDGCLVANEIAPRPHNSGHWTMDGCTVSQFENHVRAVCGLPLGLTDRHSNVEMVNLIGDDIDEIEKYMSMPNAGVHLYGKAETRPRRKMGHVNIVTPMVE